MMRVIAMLTLACALDVCAADAHPKYIFPGFPGAAIPACPIGQAIKYEMVCDPGSRAPVYETVFPQLRVPGVALCRARWVGCGEIRGYVPRATFDGMEVRDAQGDELVAVTFGLESLLGEHGGANDFPSGMNGAQRGR